MVFFPFPTFFEDVFQLNVKVFWLKIVLRQRKAGNEKHVFQKRLLFDA